MTTRLTQCTGFHLTLGSLVLPWLLSCAAPDEPPPPATEVAVETGLVAEADLRAWVDAYGTVKPAPAAGGRAAGGALVTAPVAGLVRSVPVAEGQTVAVGDVLVRLDDRVEQAAVDKAGEAAKRAELTLAREQSLLAQENTSQKAVEAAAAEAAAARADLESARARLALVDPASPLAGVVTRVAVQPGETVGPGTLVAEVVDLSRLVVSLPVPAPEAVLLEPGKPAEILLEDSGEPAAEGIVAYVSPSVDPRTGTARVRIDLPPDSELWPGRLVHVRVVREEHAGCLAVPSSSVYTDHDGRSSLAVVEGDTAVRREVTVGLRDANLVEVSGGGLKAGDRVVTVGSYALPDKTRVKIVNPDAPTS